MIGQAQRQQAAALGRRQLADQETRQAMGAAGEFLTTGWKGNNREKLAVALAEGLLRNAGEPDERLAPIRRLGCHPPWSLDWRNCRFHNQPAGSDVGRRSRRHCRPPH